MVESVKIMKNPCRHCYTWSPKPCSRPPLTHASAEASWICTGSLGLYLVGSLLLSPGSWFTQDFVCDSKSLFSQSCVRFGSSKVGLMAASSNCAYAILRSTAPKAPAPAAIHF